MQRKTRILREDELTPEEKRIKAEFNDLFKVYKNPANKSTFEKTVRMGKCSWGLGNDRDVKYQNNYETYLEKKGIRLNIIKGNSQRAQTKSIELIRNSDGNLITVEWTNTSTPQKKCSRSKEWTNMSAPQKKYSRSDRIVVKQPEIEIINLDPIQEKANPSTRKEKRTTADFNAKENTTQSKRKKPFLGFGMWACSFDPSYYPPEDKHSLNQQIPTSNIPSHPLPNQYYLHQHSIFPPQESQEGQIRTYQKPLQWQQSPTVQDSTDYLSTCSQDLEKFGW